eukprot:2360271-Amphidinium_carterae.1
MTAQYPSSLSHQTHSVQGLAVQHLYGPCGLCPQLWKAFYKNEEDIQCPTPSTKARALCRCQVLGQGERQEDESMVYQRQDAWVTR